MTDASSHSTHSSLLAQIRNDDSNAWEQFAKTYGPKVFAWCRRMRLQAADANDVTQKVFQSVVGSIKGFRHDAPKATLRGWLYQITLNKVRDLAREQGKAPKVVGGSIFLNMLQELADPLAESDSISHDTSARSILQPIVKRVRMEVTDKTWEAFWLSTVQNLSANEVGEKLAMTAGAVRVAKHRVTCLFKKYFKAQFSS